MYKAYILQSWYYVSYGRFSINEASGEIKTVTALDRETTDQHIIRVIAKDKVNEVEVQVMINVSDINDHSPVFSQRHYVVAVKEQRPAYVILNLTVCWLSFLRTCFWFVVILNVMKRCNNTWIRFCTLIAAIAGETLNISKLRQRNAKE